MTVSRKPLLKKDIEIAQAHTKSAAEAARYLRVSYMTYLKYAKTYGIHEQHKNQGGKGIPRHRNWGPVGLKNILAGNHPRYSHRRLKERMIMAGIKKNECELCGFKETRPDGRAPLQLYCKDDNPYNLKLENLELRCFNCYYLTVGKVDAKVLSGFLGGKKHVVGPEVFDKDMQDRIEEEGVNLDIDEIQKEAQQEIQNETDSDHL